MFQYLQWLSIKGVWGPLALLASWLLLARAAPATWGWGLAVVGIVLTVATAHALALASLAGLILLASGRAARVRATLVSALVGGTSAAFVLARLYFNLGT